MIRINLIAAERRSAGKAGGGALQLGQKVTILGSVILLFTFLLLGWRYWALGQQEAQMTADILAARREEARLAEVLKQVTEFEAQSAQLKQRLDLIAELRRGQSAPVHIVDQVSRSLPEMTWLTSLRQQEYDITIEGRAMSLAALSDFVSNLENTRYFRRPVEIIESQVVRGQNDGPEIIQFTIRGSFQMAGIEPGAPPAKGAPNKGGKKIG